jgi:DNA-binding NtrC family response regulator
MNIYLLEDEFIITKILFDFLRDLGHEVTPFYSISELFKNHSNGKGKGYPDLLIIDLKASNDSGIKHVQEIHKRFPDAPILVMSAILPTREAISNGVYSYLNTPIKFSELELILTRFSEWQSNQKISSFKENVHGGGDSDSP